MNGLFKITNGECITVGGNKVGASCKFPFVYDLLDDYPYVPATILRWFSPLIKFENCTAFQNSGRNWCATKVTSNGKYVGGHWGECPDTIECNAVEGSWLSWESWSDWTNCSDKDSVCGGRGIQSQSPIRRTFSRKIHSRNVKVETDKKTQTCLLPQNV